MTYIVTEDGFTICTFDNEDAANDWAATMSASAYEVGDIQILKVGSAALPCDTCDYTEDISDDEFAFCYPGGFTCGDCGRTVPPRQ